jgi:hypothetical protein
MNVHYTVQAARPMLLVKGVPFHQWASPDGTLWTQFFRMGAGYLLRFPELADFEVSADGRSVKGWPALGVTPTTVEHLYLNQVLPLALSRQGELVLHGSAVDIGGQGVAFLGESGRGKSTLAASFATAGTRFLTDDGLLLKWVDGCCTIIPSHPSIRLWADSRAALVNERVSVAPAVSFTDKSRIFAGPGVAFCTEDRPLRHVYFLGNGEAQVPTINLLRPAAALVELVKHSFLLDIEARDMLVRHFDDLTRLAELPIYFWLDYPRVYEALSPVRELIARHVSPRKESKRK